MAGTDLASYVEGIPSARKSAGSEWQIDCPFCSRHHHLYINIEEGEGWDGKPRPAGRWICFGCGERSMRFEALIMELEGISFDAARSMMGHWKAGGYSWKRAHQEAAPRVPGVAWLPPEFEPVTKVWPKYLDTRRISRQLAAEFNLGVCRRHDKCPECRPSGGCAKDMSHRIILPLDCPLGRDFQARAIFDGMEPRYMSGPDCGQLLFGWHTIEDSDMAVIVEGPFDAMAVVAAGLPCVAIMGKSLRDGQADLIKRRRRRYVIMLDPLKKDPEAVDKACEIAWALGGDVADNIRASVDPGDASHDEIRGWVERAKPPRDALAIALEHRIAREIR